MKHNCTVIKDLLPLYADEVCSEDSRKMVAEHLADCPECRKTLEKMNSELVITADRDIKVINRIKQRIRIERIVIAAVIIFVVLTSLPFTNVFLTMERTMDYEAHELAENVYCEEDEKGNVWLVKQSYACTAFSIALNRMDDNGYTMWDEEFDKENSHAFLVTLKEQNLQSLSMNIVGGDSELWRERTLLINSENINHDKINEIYYYDDTNDAKYLLWERGERND
ncbi:MAG: zf-HC2 domain-containing protein [Ruminococcus sp.]|nr:zf-HC2 domain-containing protein [Ruminococcus sp.]